MATFEVPITVTITANTEAEAAAKKKSLEVYIPVLKALPQFRGLALSVGQLKAKG